MKKRFCNLPNKVMAVTGGICSGKTTYCKKLEKEGKHVFYADKIVKRIYEKRSLWAFLWMIEQKTEKKIIDRVPYLGPTSDSLNETPSQDLSRWESINFKNLRELAFNDSSILNKLEFMIEEHFEGEFLKEYIERGLNEPEIDYDRGRSGTEYPFLYYQTIYIEHPLVHQQKIVNQFDEVITLEVDYETQIGRIVWRDGCSIKTAEQIIERQRS